MKNLKLSEVSDLICSLSDVMCDNICYCTVNGVYVGAPGKCEDFVSRAALELLSSRINGLLLECDSYRIDNGED